MSRKVPYRPRIIDRVVFGVLATLHLAIGTYLVGPWYLTAPDDTKAPLYAIFNSEFAVVTYGTLTIIDGFALLWCAVAGISLFHTRLLTAALLSGFLLRLYSLIGVVLVLESWRPPSYLSHAATIVVLGAYWLWVRYCVRTVQ